MGIVKLNFYFEFFEKKVLLPFYKRKNNKSGNDAYGQGKETDAKNIYVVNCIPPYLDLEYDDENVSFGVYKAFLRKGFLIDLTGFSTIDDYMRVQLGKKGKSNVVRRLRKLESCFDITYKIFYGDIDKEKYDELFEIFESMIIKRFDQKKQEHTGLKKWDFYKEHAYDLILEKKASLLVISDKEKPIVLGLGFHSQNVFDSAITTYDINYAKFGLGNIAVLKKLEWCMDNGQNIFDMRWGELPYKYSWCNVVEDLECNIFYSKKSLLAKAVAFTVCKGLILKKRLSERKRSNGKIETSGSQSTENENFVITDQDKLPESEKLERIDFMEEGYQFLVKPIYDFQYSNSIHSNNIQVFKERTGENTFYVSDSAKVIKLSC